jgi:beta-glucanase (GH16 family)
LPERLRPVSWLSYGSGMITTAKSFSCTFCLVAMRARLPKGRGLWPAFWMIPTDQSWPPEIDIIEVLGHDTKLVHSTTHWKDRAGAHKKRGFQIEVGDLSAQFNEFAVNWTENKISWQINGRTVAEMTTPKSVRKPMYIVLNLAVGGWAGRPSPATRFPALYEIDWVRAFSEPRR